MGDQARAQQQLKRVPQIGQMPAQITTGSIAKAQFGNQVRIVQASLSYMYCESDAKSYKRVQERIAEMTGAEVPEEFLRLYLTIIAPGGAGTDEERCATSGMLQRKAPRAVWTSLKKIKRIFKEYRDAAGIDAGPYIRRVLFELGGYGQVWVGVDHNFPSAGFFTTTSFTLEDGEAAEMRFRSHE